MHASTLKRAPVLGKFKFLATRIKQIFKFGKAQQRQKSCKSINNNGNYEFENNNNNNNELSKLASLLTSEMAQNAANEWLLQQAVFNMNGAFGHTPYTTADEESQVICLQTDAGHFYWNSAATLEAQTQQEMQQLVAFDWK